MRGATVKLTPKEIATLTLPPGKSDVLYFDDNVPGLALRVRASGKRSWVLQYRVGSKQRRLSLGAASALSLTEVRRRAGLLHAETKLGHDPAGAKEVAKARAGETFEALLGSFLARQKEELRPRALAEVERHLAIHVRGLHKLPIADITRRDIATVLSSIATKLSGASANRVQSSLSSLFAWAISEGLFDINPVIGIDRRKEHPRKRLIEPDELRAIWAALRDDAYSDIVRLLILTAGRREEIGALRWSEVDFDRGLITLPPERTKNHREHEIVLSAPATAILRSRPRLTYRDGTPCDLIFGRGQRGFSGWVGSKLDLDKRMGRKLPGWTLHDFRRLVSTTLHNELRVLPHVVEVILGHVGHRAGVAGHYNLADYRQLKAEALQRWAAYVLDVVDGRKSRVVTLQRA
jgi:integrase